MKISCVFFLCVSLFCVTSQASTSSDAQLKQKMELLRSVLSQLIPDVISEERFNSPQNSKRIESNVKKLAELAHDIPVGQPSGVAERDPSITMMSGLFKEDALLALTHLRSGHKTYARTLLKAIPNFCIACHTRSSGLDLSSLEQQVPNDLTPLERAEFFNATRQFDRALEEFEKIISDASIAQSHKLEWERAARYGIATAVRVKRDPDRALALVDRVLSTPDAPLFLKEDATSWQKSLKEWKVEPAKTVLTPDDLFAEAKKMIEQTKSVQKYPADRSADILYLRASATLHDFLSKVPDDSRGGEALLLLGECYESLQDMQIWSLHDLYYETCIRKFPHTPAAHACYVRYEQSIFFGYTGTGGTMLPPEVQKQLNQLKALAGN